LIWGVAICLAIGVRLVTIGASLQVVRNPSRRFRRMPVWTYRLNIKPQFFETANDQRAILKLGLQRRMRFHTGA
jgi:hypothetical protein